MASYRSWCSRTVSTTERTAEPSYAGRRNSHVSVCAIVLVPGPASLPGFPDGDITNLSDCVDMHHIFVNFNSFQEDLLSFIKSFFSDVAV